MILFCGRFFCFSVRCMFALRQGPVGVQSCYCGPVLHRLECRLARDKQDILQRLDTAHSRLDAKIDGLERKTQQQLQGLQRTVDSLGLESSAASLEKARNSLVLVHHSDDCGGHLTPPLPPLLLDLADSTTTSAHTQSQHSKLDSGDTIEQQRINGIGMKSSVTFADMDPTNHLSSEVQYTLDKLGLDGDAGSGSKGDLKALRNRLALTRIREQRELDAIVEHYERRHPSEPSVSTSTKIDSRWHASKAIGDSADPGPSTGDDAINGYQSQSEESEDEDDNKANILPPPIFLSSEKASPVMHSDSR